MPRVEVIEYGEETSVRISDYQYFKPRLVVRASVNDDESFDEALVKVKEAVRERLDKIAVEIYKREKVKGAKKK